MTTNSLIKKKEKCNHYWDYVSSWLVAESMTGCQQIEIAKIICHKCGQVKNKKII